MGRRGFFATIFAALSFRPQPDIERIGKGRTAMIYAHIGESVPLLQEWCKVRGFDVQRVILVNTPSLLHVLNAKDCKTVVCSPWMEASVADMLKPNFPGPHYTNLVYEVGKMGRAAGHDWYVTDLEYGAA